MITLPTWVTLSRLIAIPIIFGLFLWQDSELSRLIALSVFIIAAITDWLDGYLARKLNQITELGKFLDPLVDKVLTIALFLLFIELGQVPAWAVFLIITRELLITAWRGAPSTFLGESKNRNANRGDLRFIGQNPLCDRLFLDRSGTYVNFWHSLCCANIKGLVII